jgi:hypothetical protein
MNAKSGMVIQEEINEQGSELDNNRTELTKLEMELCKQNFQFYDK